MKKASLIIYTLIIFVFGAIIGGTLAYSSGASGARVFWGQYQAGIAFVDENTVNVTIYQPKKIKQIDRRPSGQITIVLE